MKRLLIIFSAIILMLTFASAVSAESACDVVITGGNITGDKYSVTVSIKNIKVDGGIFGADIYVAYDTSVLEYESAEAKAVDGWQMDYVKGTGEIELHPSEISADLTKPVTKDNAVSYTINFKVIDKSGSSTELSIGQNSTVNIANYESMSVSGSKLTAAIVKPLSAPTGMAWDGDTAKWNSVDGAADYSVQLYKNEKKFGDAVKTGGKTEYSAALNESGSYTFTVTAIAANDSGNTNSTPSNQSPSRTIVGTLSAPSIELTGDVQKGGLKYQITDKNGKGTVEKYEITLYAAGSETAIASFTATSKAAAVPSEYISLGTSYSATVKAISADPDINHDSEVSSKCKAAEAVNAITKIEVITAPKADYNEGEALDLTSARLKLTYSDGSSKEISFSEFSINGITPSIKNGTSLKTSHNKKKITVSAASGASVNLVTLTVKENACKHDSGTKIVVSTAPTCGEVGVNHEVCNSCGAKISETEIPATGEHVYGDWRILLQPTPSSEGLRVRDCDKCTHIDEERLPALVITETTTGEADVTTPEETDIPYETEPDEESPSDDNQNKLSDLSKIFLIAVIVVFSLIMLFMIFGVWSSSKRSRARRTNGKSKR